MSFTITFYVNGEYVVDVQHYKLCVWRFVINDYMKFKNYGVGLSSTGKMCVQSRAHIGRFHPFIGHKGP